MMNTVGCGQMCDKDESFNASREVEQQFSGSCDSAC